MIVVQTANAAHHVAELQGGVYHLITMPLNVDDAKAIERSLATDGVVPSRFKSMMLLPSRWRYDNETRAVSSLVRNAHTECLLKVLNDPICARDPAMREQNEILYSEIRLELDRRGVIRPEKANV